MMDETTEDLVISRITTQDNVVDNLRKLILNHHFKPKERLMQDELAKLLGVSRTPIREALLKLAGEGLVTFSPYKGASVADFSTADLDEIYTVRIALESYAAYLAAQRITDEQIGYLFELLQRMQEAIEHNRDVELLQLNRQFHTRIYTAANERRLLDLINNYLDQAEIYRRIFVNINNSREEMVKHQAIIEALRAHDADRAQELTRSHLRKTAVRLANFFKEQRD